jgi:SAM-dependent methyltransferase
MDDPNALARMRADWNQRADEDANYYVAFGRRNQDDDEFFATAADVVRNLERELRRTSGRDAALEIGCGPGRLMRPLSPLFREIHGVDISNEMIRLAGERLRDVPNAHPRVNSGADLSAYPDAKFDFVYSYAVFQHIPDRELVFAYLREAQRVLKPGGVLRCQLNSLPPHSRPYDTWSGVRISPAEIVDFARAADFQLLALEQTGTQYMWVTCRKKWDGLAPDLPGAGSNLPRLIDITNARTGEAASPVSGPLAALCLWVEGLPDGCDLISMAVKADGRECRLIYIDAPSPDGITQVNFWLPEEIRTGLVPVQATWLGRPLCEGWARLMPAPPMIPRLAGVTDGVNLLSGARIVTRSVKAIVMETRDSSDFAAEVDGIPVTVWRAFCTDASEQRWEFDFPLPESIGPGPHVVRLRLGRRELPPAAIEVA